jgi:hypothetical protein
MVSAAPHRPRCRRNCRHLGRIDLCARESLDHDLGQPRAEIVGAAELEREENRPRAPPIGRSRPQRSEGRRMDEATSASLGALRRERFAADRARRPSRLRDRAPARRTDASPEDLFDGADFTREAE